MSNGYMKLYRSLLGNAVFDNADLLKVWIWCLLKASYYPHFEMVGSQKIELLPGQFIFGRKGAASFLKMNESHFYRLIKRLEIENKIELKPNNKFTLVTLINWEFYQGLDAETEQQMNNKRTTNEHYIRKKRNKEYIPPIIPLKKGGRKKRNVEASYDIELFEQMLNGKD